MFDFEEAEALAAKETAAIRKRALLVMPVAILIIGSAWRFASRDLATAQARIAAGASQASVVPHEIKPAIVLVCAVLLGILLLQSLLSALLRLPRLTLTPDAVSVTRLWGTRSYPWSSLGGFYIHFVQTRSNTARFLASKVTGPVEDRRATKKGYATLVPVKDGTELAAVLNRCRDAALGVKPGTTAGASPADQDDPRS